MAEENTEANQAGEDDLLGSLMRVEPQYASHHRVEYAASAIEIAARLAEKHPYAGGDPYQTALDLIDEAGSFVRLQRIVDTEGIGFSEVTLRDVVAVASRKIGLPKEELLE